MYLLFEETGKFLAGRILSEADTSAQVELDSGKRVKVKAANMLLKFEKPEPQTLMAGAQAVASGIELDMAWEFAPEGDFGFAELARDYFSEHATLEQQAGTLLAHTILDVSPTPRPVPPVDAARLKRRIKFFTHRTPPQANALAF